MTLIATHISKYGIVQASDSNLTAGGKVKSPGKKVFDLPFGVGALAVAGSYRVGGREMDAWMSECIDAYGMNADGSYIGPGKRECELSDDFWARDYPQQRETQVAMAIGGWHSYFNGFPEGRIAYLGLTRAFNAFFRQMWSVPGWMFRPPASLEEMGAFAEVELRAMDALSRSSDYPARYIGGEPQVRVIASPPNTVTF